LLDLLDAAKFLAFSKMKGSLPTIHESGTVLLDETTQGFGKVVHFDFDQGDVSLSTDSA
jgi:hypothetical protein